MSWTEKLSNALWGKSKNVLLDLKRLYIKIQFLTEEQKIKKDLALKPLIEQAENNFEIVIPYEDHYKCSYRFTFKANQTPDTQTKRNQITLKEIINNIILSTDNQTRNFYQSNVNGIQLVMRNNEKLDFNEPVPLYNENQIFDYDPKCILEIIYNKKTFWERTKYKAKEVVKKIPSLMATLIEKFIGLFLSFLGINGGITSLIWKCIPSGKVISMLGTIIAMLFPALAPLLGLTKLIL